MNQVLSDEEFPEPEQLMFEGIKVRFATSTVKAAGVSGLASEPLRVGDRLRLVGTAKVVGVHHDRDPKIGALIRVHVLEVEESFAGIRKLDDIAVAHAFDEWGGGRWDAETNTLTIKYQDLTIDPETGEILEEDE